MIHKIGNKETTRSLILFSSPVLFLSLLGNNGANLGTGAIINTAAWLAVSLIMLLSVKFYFKICGNTSIIDSSKEALGAVPAFVVALVFFALIFLFLSHTLALSADHIQTLTLGSLSARRTLWLICFASGACAWFGVEAVTRLGYVIFFVSVVVASVLVLISAGGINPDNIYPIFGSNFETTLKNYNCVGLFGAIAPLLILCGGLKNKKAAFGVAVKTIVALYGAALVFFLLYAFTVPHPLGKIFDGSTQALFASASSGEVLHRFEIFLVSILIFACISALCVGITVCAFILSKLTHISDTKPYVIVLSPLVGYAGLTFTNFYETCYVALAIAGFLVPLIVGTAHKLRIRS